MKYDKESKKINVGITEFVNISRRMLSATPSNDTDEPIVTDSSMSAFKSCGISSPDIKRLKLEFSCGKYSYILSDNVYFYASSPLIMCSVSSSVAKIRKEEEKEARGESFIAAYLYMMETGETEILSKIIYHNKATRESKLVEEKTELQKAKAFFEKCKDCLELYAKPEIERVTKRLPTLEKLKFPYKNIRPGQYEFINSVYRTISRGGKLYAAAPTGTGKTISALFPAIRALGKGRCEKIFYFTPKATTAIAAAECIELCVQKGADIRAVCLSSKEKLCDSGMICLEDKYLCKCRICNKVSEAALALYDAEIYVVKTKELNDFAKRFGVCPHELSLSYAELCDVVIGDINYLFSPDVYIRRFFTRGGSYAFLIDEAHNLPDRAREMYSANLTEEEIIAPSLEPILGDHSKAKKTARTLAAIFHDTLYPYLKEEILKDENGDSIAATHLSDIPPKLFNAFEIAVSEIENEIYENITSRDEEKRARLKFLYSYLGKLKTFLNVMNVFDSRYEMFVFYENGKIKTKLFCIDPEDRISERLSKGSSAVFFSGTFSPLHYYKSTLGGDGTSDILEVNSPFDKDQLSVSIMHKISTRFSEREDTISAVCRAIAATVSAKRGNYMVFTPSFKYAEALAKVFSAKYPKINVMLQKRGMSETEKNEFLNAFSKNDKSYLIGFCVMGGIYSEGIDLAGESLIGAVIVGIGLPSLSYEREAMANYYQDKYEEGKEFAYIYPGINRVLQAAGRVIRREDDKGVIVLIDDRFDDPIYKKLIPKFWGGMNFIGDAASLRCELDKFWHPETEK